MVLQDSSSWSSPPLVLLRDIHNGLLANYDFKDSAPLPPGRNSQDGDSQQQEVGILLIPQLNRLNEAFLVRGEDASNMLTIPSQNKVTQQIISLWQPFKDLNQAFAVSRRAEQLRLRSQQRIIATAEDSVLRTEMANLESQEEDAPRRVLWFKPMNWLTTSALVPPTRVPRRLTTGRLIKSLTFFAQHTKRKRNRWLGAGVSDVGTSSWLVTLRTRRVRCLQGFHRELDLHITHESWALESSSDPSINGHLHYPNDLETEATK